MARAATIKDGELIDRIGAVFRDVGYNGATLSLLSKATGLQRASLYHRFPGGKEQMATEVLDDTVARVESRLLAPLRASEDPAIRAKNFLRALNQFYNGGENACLQNVLATAAGEMGPFGERIATAFDKWSTSLVALFRDDGLDLREARRRAQLILALVHGGLVMTRGIGSTQPFKQCLREIRSLLPS